MDRVSHRLLRQRYWQPPAWTHLPRQELRPGWTELVAVTLWPLLYRLIAGTWPW